MSKIANDGLTRSNTECFITVSTTNMATVDVKELTEQFLVVQEKHYIAYHID